MKKPVSFTTINGNSFLYSPFRNQLLLSHPIIRHLFDLDATGTNLKNYIESYPSGQTFCTPENYQFTFEELQYQWKKYRFLKQNHFFKAPRPINLSGRLPASRVAKDLKKIQQVIFETTEECNLACTYCTYGKFYINKERGDKKFNISGAKRALEHLLAIRDKDSRQLMISFYGGEPLKNFNFIKEVVGFLKSGYGKLYSFKFNISSNGLLLSKHSEFLVENDFEISVSLDGDETANSFRLISANVPSHGLVIKNLDYIKDRYPEFFERRVSFLTVLHSRNSFSGVHEYFKKRYAKVPLTSMISTTNIQEEQKATFSETFLNGIRNDFQDRVAMQELFTANPTVKTLANVIEKYTGIVYKNHFQIISRLNGDEGTKAFVPTATCMPFSLRVFLTADGSILPCEHISRDFELGQLKNGEVKIDNDSIAALFNQRFDKIRSLCNQCFLADNCKECVFNTRIETAYPECDFFLDETKFKNFLSRYFSLIDDNFQLYTRLLNEAFHEQ